MSLKTATKEVRAFIIGESYWKVTFHSGRELSELDTRTYVDHEQVIRVRAVEWLEDLVGSGDLKNVKEVLLCTPDGTAHLTITEPYTAFQLSRGTLSALTGERIKNCQIIGRIDDKASGAATAYVWDVQEQALYQVVFNIHDGLPSWREGVIPVGVLNLKAMDVRL